MIFSLKLTYLQFRADFEGHPYKVIDDEEMNTLIKSIQEQGILSPLIVRPLENTEDEYELISGHRRMAACKVLGIETMPVIIREMNDDEVVLTVTIDIKNLGHLESVIARLRKIPSVISITRGVN